jgi:hypothetical protein
MDEANLSMDLTIDPRFSEAEFFFFGLTVGWEWQPQLHWLFSSYYFSAQRKKVVVAAVVS